LWIRDGIFIIRGFGFTDVLDGKEPVISTTAHIPQVDAHSPCGLHAKAYAPRAFSAFTLMEVLIVVVVVGLLATLVIPKFSAANQQTRQNSLKDELQYLRTQIMVYKAQHEEVPPGYPCGDPMALPTMEDFAAQMTQHSNILCNLSEKVSPAYPYGPYLRELPVDPMNSLSTIVMVGNNEPMPTPDGRTGWIYKAQTQELIANVKGKDDSGIPYRNY
jgi:general secretion pathway protein G